MDNKMKAEIAEVVAHIAREARENHEGPGKLDPYTRNALAQLEAAALKAERSFIKAELEKLNAV